MGSWTTILIEAFCTYSWASKKKWKGTLYKGKFTPGKKGTPTVTVKRPNWCKKQNKKMLPQFRCMANMIHQKHCPFFAYCNAVEKEYLWDNLFYTNVPKEVRKLIKKGVIKVKEND